MSYADFLARKALTVAPVGFEPTDYTANLFQFQRDIVALACKLGRFCVWADCGMGKTPMQLEWASQVCRQIVVTGYAKRAKGNGTGGGNVWGLA